MRPRRLEVEGFVAFRQPTVIDFAGADLFALVGPTGAGKTSLLDAITFTLYGSVPRLDDRRAVAPVVSQNLTEARLRLDFDLGPDTYTAVRVVRSSKTGATTKEARLERGDQVLAGTADEVTTAVADLLGLTYDHFTTCVSLPQGQFARFLHDKPRDRQDLLVRLLDLGLYDEVAGTARQRAALAGGQVDVLEGQLERLADATPERLDEARAQAAQLAGLAGTLTEARPELDRLAEQERAAVAEVERGNQRLAVLRELRLPAGVAELSELLAAAKTERGELADAEEAVAAALARAEDHVAGLPRRTDVEQLQRALVRRHELDEQIAKGEEAAREAAAAVSRQQTLETEAEAERERCAVVLERLRVERRAQALVPELKLGEPCPVCRHPVDALPEGHPDHHSELAEARSGTQPLDQAEAALAQAESHLKAVARTLNDARTQEARVDEKLTRIRQEQDDLIPRIVEAVAPDTPIATALSDVEDLLDVVGDAEEAVARARKDDRAARQARLAADRRYEELRARESEARRAFDQARDALAALEPPAPERRDLAADWEMLLAWAGERRPALEEELAQHRGSAEAARQRAAERLNELLAACCDAGVPLPVGSGSQKVWPGEAVAAAHARADGEVQRIEAALAEADSLRQRVRQMTEERQVAETLAGHLAANRFEKWLLDEAMHRLVGGASTILADLTGGTYALSVDRRSGGFTVIDHANASQPRPARTLSGGETFLASLALALALADQVAELAAGGAARLESLFLDEGFGTLDADTLDVVATAIDELGARGRMVGVVTHVRELAERLPVRFEVRKVGGSSTVERIDA